MHSEQNKNKSYTYMYHTCNAFGIKRFWKFNNSNVNKIECRHNTVLESLIFGEIHRTLLTILQIDDIMVIYGYKLILAVHTVCIYISAQSAK